MKLFAGLGNPGAKYQGNRHNIGFMAVEHIAAAHGFSPWRKKFNALISEGSIGTERVMLLKPETFMNDSGRAVGEAMRFLKIAEADVYMAYGRDAQAEEILKEALGKAPSRIAVHAKLLEIYATRKDAKNFEQTALKLKGLTGGAVPLRTETRTRSSFCKERNGRGIVWSGKLVFQLV